MLPAQALVSPITTATPSLLSDDVNVFIVVIVVVVAGVVDLFVTLLAPLRFHSLRRQLLARTNLLSAFIPSRLTTRPHHPPSHLLFIRLTATNRLPTHSGLAPAPHCIGERGVLGGSVPCQSHNHTVPKEPSPSTLRGVYERVDAIDENKFLG